MPASATASDVESSHARAHEAPGGGEQAAEWVPIGQLLPWGDNPRKNDGDPVRRVMESIKRFGFASPIIARRANGEVIAGHTRLKAAEALGLKLVPVRYLDLDPADAHLLALADNRLNEFAEWDEVKLQSLLGDFSLPDVDLAGWDADALGEMADSILSGEPKGEVEEDEIPPVPTEAITKPGDVWTLGAHRLACGDCRDAATVQRLFSGHRVNVAFTSPPYAAQREYDRSSGFEPIKPDDYVGWFEAVQANVRSVLAPDGSWFVNIKEHCDDGQRSLYVKDLTLAHARAWGWRFVDELIWTHAGLPGAFPNRFKNGWEPIFHFTTGKPKFRPQSVGHESEECFSGKGTNAWGSASVHGETGNHGWSGTEIETHEGIALPTNVVSAHHTPGSMQGAKHPAAFPVALPTFFIRAYSDEGDRIFDPFMGSGTTLIAAEQTKRVAFGTELSPGYCDVIIARWEALTGRKAELAK